VTSPSSLQQIRKQEGVITFFAVAKPKQKAMVALLLSPSLLNQNENKRM